MKQKAIKDLTQLTEEDFFKEISKGMDLTIINAQTIEQDAERFYDSKSNSYDILMSVACEEAAKSLILLDAVRCPRQSKNFSHQLRRFNNHLAKGIYAKVCDWHAAHKKELCQYLEMERREFYLDGPNDVDWAFPNSILHERERNMYVDYVESDGEHFWLDPLRLDRIFGHHTPMVVSIAEALKRTRCTEPDALRQIADIWRARPIEDTTPYSELRQLNLDTLAALEKNGILDESDQDAVSVITNHLPYPLYDVDLSLVKVNKKELWTEREYKVAQMMSE